MVENNFSAVEQSLGYYYQIPLALKLLLDTKSLDSNTKISLEKLDDIEIVSNGNGKTLFQSKHHKNKSLLTDKSIDLCKTINNWTTNLKNGSIELNLTIFVLITTSESKDDSIGMLLGKENRDEQKAIEKMIFAINDSKSSELKKYSELFLQMSEYEKLNFVKKIYILSGSEKINDINKSIKNELLLATRLEYVKPVYERLLGWWFNSVIEVLSNKTPLYITLELVLSKIREISEKFTEDSLPTDFLNEKPDEINVSSDSRIFVKQLKEIKLETKQIEIAIINYYKAYSERSSWARNDLLFPNEIENYEKRLKEEWEIVRGKIFNQLAKNLSSEDLEKVGRDLYFEIMLKTIPIRPKVTEPYLTRGSYHILADQKNPDVYWHPNFLEHLKNILFEEASIR